MKERKSVLSLLYQKVKVLLSPALLLARLNPNSTLSFPKFHISCVHLLILLIIFTFNTNLTLEGFRPQPVFARIGHNATKFAIQQITRCIDVLWETARVYILGQVMSFGSLLPTLPASWDRHFDMIFGEGQACS